LTRRRFLQVSAAAAVGTVGFDFTPEQEALVKARRQAATLRVAWESPATLDPRSVSGDSEISFLNAVYDYLIDWDAGSNLVPRLAESWEVSDDGLVYTLTLREGATFHDGSPLTVDDVIWTFEWQIADEGTVANLLSSVESIEAGEGNTVVFTLTETNPDFLYNLADNKTVILKSGTEDFETAFNGTGPFRVSEYLPGDRAIFVPNEDYWGTVPSLQTLEFIFFEDQQAGISALQGGVVDVVLRMPNLDYLALSEDAALNAIDIPTNGFDLVRLRADMAPGDNPLVQQAFKLATDRAAIFDSVQLGFGAVGKDSPIGPQFAAYFNTDVNVPERDPAAARALLEEAGHPDGLELTLNVPGGGGRPDFATLLASQWEDAGIRVSIEIQDENSWYAADDWIEAQLSITGWGSRATPQFYFDTMVKSDGVWNEAHWADDEIDALIATAGSSLDQEARINAYKEIQRIMIERGPLIIPYFFGQFMVTGSTVSGIDLHPFPGRTRFDSASI
jgi:peptide/nickel transport system substrate-binding protein